MTAHRPWRAAAVALLLASVGLTVLLGSAAAHAEEEPPDVPAAGDVWFGPGLDWTRDSAEAYADRLGLTPSLYAQRVAYPLTVASREHLRSFVDQVARQGAVAVVDLEPTTALARLDRADAGALAEELAALHEEHDTFFMLRFAPEMNGSWYVWGQQPTDFVRAFRQVARVVHATTPHAAMVWSPVYGAGYPYGAAYGDIDPDRGRGADRLDTDDNGVLDGRDDPYGPYWPGRAAVDWVGLTLYHFGEDVGREDNELDPRRGGETGEVERSEGFRLDVVPRPDAFRDQLRERFNYDVLTGRRSFYERWAKSFAKPFLVETGALWIPDPAGDPELAIKQGWWQQVLAADEEYPLIRAISWLEQRRPETEAGGRVVDWRATRTDRLADALATDLVEDGAELGPVTDPVDPDDPVDPVAGSSGADVAAAPEDVDVAPALHPTTTARDLTIAGAALLALALVALALRGRTTGVPALTATPGTPTEAGRDRRVDVARGLLLLGAVALHVEIAAGAHGPASRVVGATVGMAGFVLVSGLALGLSQPSLVERVGALSAAGVRWRRAAVVWSIAVLVALAAFAVGFVPGVDVSPVTRSTDGEVDLFAVAEPLLEYPVPWDAVRPLLLLQTAPWPVIGLGLFVVLLILAAGVLEVVRRGGWWIVLPLSWAAYVAGRLLEPDLLPSPVEDTFPPLLYQLVLVHAIVVAHHRAWLRRRIGPTAAAWGTVALAAVHVAVLQVLWLTGRTDWLTEAYAGPLAPGHLATLLVVAVVVGAVLTWTGLGESRPGRALAAVGRRPLLVVAGLVPLVVVVDALT